METKDLISISLSSLAFLLSLAATIISLVRSSHERKRAIKKEITDTLGKIVSTSLDGVKLQRETADKDPLYFQNVSGILNQQNAFLLKQVTYLTDQIPTLVNTIEYNTIATATAGAGDLMSAEKYYRKAIEVAPNNYYRSLAMRSYAAFLFPQRRFEEGRDYFKKSLSLLSVTDAMARYTNGFTYQMWAWNEMNNAGSPQLADKLFERAASEFNGIDNEAVRRTALSGLQAVRAGQSVPHPAPADQRIAMRA